LFITQINFSSAIIQNELKKFGKKNLYANNQQIKKQASIYD